ncbi:MAG: tetratricopeptide repeat protein [Helicobacteraceae bacterium]|nr:tetratricopeptide repeat protein [Helicobacteraceae bacterium]
MAIKRQPRSIRREAIKLDPKNATAYYMRGITHSQLNNHYRALKDVEKANELVKQ